MINDCQYQHKERQRDIMHFLIEVHSITYEVVLQNKKQNDNKNLIKLPPLTRK